MADHPPQKAKKDISHLFLTPVDKRAFESLCAPEYPTIQEDLFVSQYLPLFLSDNPDKHIMDWLDVAGHALNPVMVFAGEEYLFTVPALFRDTPIKQNVRGRISYFDIVTGAKDHYSLSPKHGDKFLEESLRDRIPHTPVDIENLRQWNFIFERYGHPARFKIDASPADVKKADVKKGTLGEPDGFEDV